MENGISNLNKILVVSGGINVRVKVKGFELGKFYELRLGEKVFDVYFSKKKHVLIDTSLMNSGSSKLWRTRKRNFKLLIKDLPMKITEIEPEDFHPIGSEQYEHDDCCWVGDYACENYCCSCCGCSCYDYEDDGLTFEERYLESE